MTRALHWIRPIAAWAPSVLILVLSLGLTGCYTQLQTTDQDRSSSKASPARSADQTEEAQYADEYRRDYRDGVGVRYDDYAYADEYEYRYEYKYKYGAPSRYRTSFGDWYHDPFYHDPFYRSGARFSLSFHFGSPFYAYHHRPWRYSSWHRYGYSPFGPRYYTNNYYYLDDDYDGNRSYSGRTYRPRGGTVGQGTDGAAGRDNAGREAASARRAASRSTPPDSNARIGRSSAAGERSREATTGRSAPDRTTRGRVGRTTRPDRSEQPSSRGSERSARDRDGDRTSGERTGRRSSRGGDDGLVRTDRARPNEAARRVPDSARTSRDRDTSAGRIRSQDVRRTAPAARIGPARTSRVNDPSDLDRLQRKQSQYKALQERQLRERREQNREEWGVQQRDRSDSHPRLGRDRTPAERSSSSRTRSQSSDRSDSSARGSRSSNESDTSDRGRRSGRSDDDDQ